MWNLERMGLLRDRFPSKKLNVNPVAADYIKEEHPVFLNVRRWDRWIKRANLK
jgi:hypothetical protein